jgi:hypothetical protein
MANETSAVAEPTSLSWIPIARSAAGCSSKFESEPRAARVGQGDVPEPARLSAVACCASTKDSTLDEHGDSLTRARRAYAAQDWRSAAAHFDAVPPEPLAADDLAAYADAVWWLGRIEDNLRLGAAAYDAFLAESRPAEAARTAVVLGISHTARGDEPQAVGWLGRAGRLAEGIPEGRCTDTCSASQP